MMKAWPRQASTGAWGPGQQTLGRGAGGVPCRTVRSYLDPQSTLQVVVVG